jgi:hypothetical protein
MDAFTTASFNGTNLLADSAQGTLNFASGSGQGLRISADAGTDTLTFGLNAIPNSSLANSTVTLGSSTLTLGGTTTTVDGLTLTNVVATGSFSGSFIGTTDLPDLSTGDGLAGGPYDGSSTATFSVNTGSNHFISGSRASISVQDTTGASGIDLTYNNGTGVLSGVLQNSSVHIGDESVALGATGSVFSGLEASGSFSGSFEGDGSGLTGLATDLNFSGSSGNGTVNLLTQDFTIQGTNNEIETSAASQTLTIGLPDDVTIGQDLIVSRNLTVQGTASFQHNEELQIADRFILMASGSSTAGDGGLVVQQDTQNIGEVFAFDSGTTRWGLTGSFDASDTSYTPDAFMAAVVEGADANPDNAPARYDKKGNIFVGTDQEIWIYS